MSDTLSHWGAGGWAVGVMLLWFGLGFGSVLLLGRWFRRLWRRRKELGFGRLALVFVVGPLVLFGALGTLVGLVSAFAAVGGESVDPSQKARILAEGIAQAMNCTAFGILFGVPSAIALALLTRKRDDKASRVEATLHPSYLIGRTLVNLLASATPLRGERIPGIGEPLFYTVVLLLDREERVRICDDAVDAWTGTEPLLPVTPATFHIEPAIIFQSQPIVDVQIDDVGDIVVVLENRTTLQVGSAFGTTIVLESPSTQ